MKRVGLGLVKGGSRNVAEKSTTQEGDSFSEEKQESKQHIRSFNRVWSSIIYNVNLSNAPGASGDIFPNTHKVP